MAAVTTLGWFTFLRLLPSFSGAMLFVIMLLATLLAAVWVLILGRGKQEATPKPRYLQFAAKLVVALLITLCIVLGILWAIVHA